MMLGHGGSPDPGRLAAEAAEEIGGTQFFEAEFANPLESLEHYCRSSLGFQRLAYAQGIAAAALTADYQDCVDVLLPLVDHLTHDTEPEIRNAAVQQLCGLGTKLHQKDAERSLRDIETTLSMCAQQCAVDEEDEVSQAAILAFQQLVHLLPAARATAASKRAVDRLEGRATDDGTLAAVRLLAHTVHMWTPEALRRHVPRYLTRWTNHRDFGVREAVGTCMSLIVKAMPLQLCHQLLLPFFYQLCRDSNWRVRRACSADLPRLAQAMQYHQEHHQHTQQQQPQPQQQQQVRSVHDNSYSAICRSSSTGSGSTKQDGSCCSKSSSCLRSLRHPSDLASLSTGNLQALSTGTIAFHRNRSSSSVNVPLQPATTEQISAKHPMHSSFIRDGLLASSASPNNSAPPSPTSHQAGSSNDRRQQDQQQRSPSTKGDAMHCTTDLAQSNCPLEAAAPVLHDCWCALRQCMELLSADSSHWVKAAAMSGLGPFLLALPDCQIGLLLLGRFTSMAGSTVVIYEISVAVSCAQHFGQLVVRLGAERWHEMRDAWRELQTSRDPAVLCELIKGMPSLVSALGPAITSQELMPALAVLLQSHLSWVAAQLVSVLGELMEILPPSSQELILKVLDQLASTRGERSRLWRLRRDLALQLGRMAAAAGPEAVTDSIWPTAMTLCSDPVSAVRVAAASQVGPLLAALPRSLLSPRGGGSTAAVGTCSYMQGPARASSQALSLVPGCSSDGSHSSSDSLQLTPESSMNGADAVVERSSHGRTYSETGQQGDSILPAGACEAATAVPDMPSGRKINGAVHSPVAGKPVSVIVYGPTKGSNQRHHYDLSAVHGRSSLDYELDLPNALAPAPADAFATRTAESELSSSSSSSSSSDEEEDSLGNSSSSRHSSDSSDSSIGSDSDEEPVHISSGVSSKQPQYSAVMHPALQYQLPPIQPAGSQHQQQQQQNEPDIYNIRRTVVVPQAEAAISSVLPVIAQQQQQQELQQHKTPLPVVHPAMMPIGHPAMLAVGRSTPPTQPRAVPVSTLLAPRTPPLPLPAATPGASVKAKSTGDLLKVEAAAEQQHRRRNSSCNMSTPVEGAVSRAGDSNPQHSGCDASLPGLSCAAPHQYVACLISHFGCSRDHQQRQLFVSLVIGILSCCYDKLTCDQASQLLDSLEALASDDVPGVRYAVTAALQHLKQHAVVLLGGQQPQQHVHGVLEVAQEQQQEQSHDVQSDASQAQQQAAEATPADSYAAYVQQLASRSGSVSSRHGDVGHPAAAQTAAAADAGSEGSVAEDAPDVCGAPCSPACAVCGVLPRGAGADDLEWLRKLCSCHQLERLMGVVALTTGPL